MSLANIVAVLEDDAILKKFEAAILKQAAVILAATQAAAADGSITDADRMKRAFALRTLSRDGDTATRTMALIVRRYALSTNAAFQAAGTTTTDGDIESLVQSITGNAATLMLLNAAEASFRM